MTSKNSSHNAFKFTFKRMFKQCLPLGAAPGVIAFLYFALNCIITIIDAGVVYPHMTIDKDYMYCPSEFFETQFFYAILILFSCIFGLIAFNFLTNKKECNVYLSLGISKSKLFWSRCLGAAAALAITPVSIQLFELIMNLISGETVLNAVNMKLWFFQTVYLLAASLCAYAVTVLAFVNAGNVVEGILFTFLYGVFPTIFTSLSEAAYGHLTYGSAYETSVYFAGNPYYTKNWFLDIFGSITESKIINELMQFGVTEEYVTPDLTGLVFCIIAFVLILVLASIMFKKRTSEISGTIFKSYNNYRILGVLLSVLTFCLFTGFEISSRYLLADLSIISAVVVFIVVSLILTRKVSTKTAVSLAVSMAVFCIICFVGFGKSIPEVENIKSVDVSIQPELAMFNSADALGCTKKDDGSSYSRYVAGEEYFTLTSKNDIEWIRDIHKDIVEDGYRSKLDDNSADSYIVISYVLKDGSRVNRAYKYESIETYKKILGFMNTDTAKEYNKQLFDKNAVVETTHDDDYYDEGYKAEKLLSLCYRYNYISYCGTAQAFGALDKNNKVFVGFNDKDNRFVASATVDFKKDSGLRDALYKDLNNQTVEQKYFHSSSDEIGVISIESDESKIAKAYAMIEYAKANKESDKDKDVDIWQNAYWATEPKYDDAEDEETGEYTSTISKDYVFPISRESYKKNRDKAVELYFAHGFVTDSSLFDRTICRFVVTKDMVNTVKWLKDNGLYSEKASDAKVVAARGLKYDSQDNVYAKPTTFISSMINNYGFEPTEERINNGNALYFKNSGYITDAKTLQSLLENSRLCAANITNGFIVEFIYDDGTRASKFVSKYNVSNDVEKVFGPNSTSKSNEVSETRVVATTNTRTTDPASILAGNG